MGAVGTNVTRRGIVTFTSGRSDKYQILKYGGWGSEGHRDVFRIPAQIFSHVNPSLIPEVPNKLTCPGIDGVKVKYDGKKDPTYDYLIIICHSPIIPRNFFRRFLY